MRTTTLSRRNIVQLLNLNNVRKITRLQLWWHIVIWNNWEVRDLVITDKKGIKEHNTVFVLLFEKNRKTKEIHIKNYWINLALRNSNNDDDIVIINNSAPNKINELVNKFFREGYHSIFAYVKKNSKTHEYFRSKRYLGFNYSKAHSSIYTYKTGNKKDILVRTIDI